MIRFSKKEDYAIILINKLVQNYKKRLVPLSEVAREHKLPLLFLRNIASDLRKSGLIVAVEGKSGGYKLSKHPSNIEVGEVITALTKNPLFSCCQNTKDGKCAASTCPHGFSLRRLSNTILEKISGVTLDKFSTRE
ncbi:MAG: Rrf2 family transcriptional regulator [Candidatus Levybacteria bacterium]|nr:Rrf2 family transcriptional regulator [Candidatus Levybacteria bacterium]